MVLVQTEIRDVTGEPLEPNADIIRRSFQTVADEMGITPENAPRFTSFITAGILGETRDRGAVFYGLFTEGKQAGFVAVEQEADGNWFLKRLAILPDYRNGGFARQLIDRVIDHVKNRGAEKLHIGIVNEQTVLKDWYIGMGFREYRVFEIPRLPFTVCLLNRELDES